MNELIDYKIKILGILFSDDSYLEDDFCIEIDNKETTILKQFINRKQLLITLATYKKLKKEYSITNNKNDLLILVDNSRFTYKAFNKKEEELDILTYTFKEEYNKLLLKNPFGYPQAMKNYIKDNFIKTCFNIVVENKKPLMLPVLEEIHDTIFRRFDNEPGNRIIIAANRILARYSITDLNYIIELATTIENSIEWGDFTKINDEGEGIDGKKQILDKIEQINFHYMNQEFKQ